MTCFPSGIDEITGFFMGMTKSVAKVLAAMIATAAVPWPSGQMTSTISGRTHRSDTRPRQTMPGPSPQPAPTLRKMKASRFRRMLPPCHLA